MSGMSVNEQWRLGFNIGAAIAVVPATVTLLIASSRAILINVIAKAILFVASGGSVTVDIYGLSLIHVPILWKISFVTAVLGTSIMAVALTVGLVNAVYQHVSAKKKVEA